MFASFFKSKKWAFWAYSGIFFLIAINWYQTTLNVRINEWYRAFYDLCQNVDRHTLGDFYAQMKIFLWIAMPYVVSAISERYAARVWAFKWREAMTFSYFSYWKKVSKDIEGSSQRIQEDIFRFSKTIEEMGTRVLSAAMTLFAFIPVLWELSSNVPFEFLKKIPGSLVWIALLVSIGGLIISWLVGWYLPRLEYNNQKVEAAFRKELVFAEEDKINYADEEKILSLFDKIKYNYFKLYLHYCYFDMWFNSFSQFLMIVPYLIMGPGLFTKVITLGVMVQVSNAFNQEREGVSIFMNNWTTTTALRSIHMRLNVFEQNIDNKT